MAMDELGINDEMSDAEAKKKWQEVALPRGVEVLRDVCDLRNLPVPRLALIPVEMVRDMVKRDNPALVIHLGQLTAAITEAIRLERD